MAVVPIGPRIRERAFRAALEEAWAARENRRAAMNLPPRLRLHLVAPDELEPEWDSGDSNAYQDRVEAGLEPEWPDD
jgi:hypothetical protein